MVGTTSSSWVVLRGIQLVLVFVIFMVLLFAFVAGFLFLSLFICEEAVS